MIGQATGREFVFQAGKVFAGNPLASTGKGKGFQFWFLGGVRLRFGHAMKRAAVGWFWRFVLVPVIVRLPSPFLIVRGGQTCDWKTTRTDSIRKSFRAKKKKSSNAKHPGTRLCRQRGGVPVVGFGGFGKLGVVGVAGVDGLC